LTSIEGVAAGSDDLLRRSGRSATGLPRQPIPVTLVTGFAGPGKALLIDHWLLGRAADEPWALVLNESTVPARPRVQRLDLRGACVCCAALPVLRARLPALLRGRPGRLVIELGETADPAAVAALLAAPGWRPWLQPPRVVAVIGADRLGPYLDDPSLAPSIRLYADLHLRQANAVQWLPADGTTGEALARIRSRAGRPHALLSSGPGRPWIEPTELERAVD
jgi:hypothetical protein